MQLRVRRGEKRNAVRPSDDVVRRPVRCAKVPLMKIGVLTSGGDSPGMNAAIHSIVKAGHGRSHDVIGIFHGYAGLLAGEARPLTLGDVDGISRHGGTM